jgi:predicted ABC-type ATPase
VAIERVNKRERKIPIDIIISKNEEIMDNKNKYLELKADEIHLYNNSDFFVIYKSLA